MNERSTVSAREVYLSRLAEFEKYYSDLVFICACAAAIGITVAVLWSLTVGIAIAVMSACAYVRLSVSRARRILALRFKNTDGYVVISRLSPIYEGTAIVPERLIYADVREIADGALSQDEDIPLTELYIPVSIEVIGKEILPRDREITVLYEGTREEFKRIKSETDFSAITVRYSRPFPKLPPKNKPQKTNKRRK